MFPPCLPCRRSHLLCEWASELKGGPLRREGEAAVGGQAHSQAEAASFSRSLQTPDKSWYSFHWKLNGVHSSAFRKKNNTVDLGKLCRHRWDSVKHKVEGKVLKCHSGSSTYTYENPMMTICDSQIVSRFCSEVSRKPCVLFSWAHTLPVLHRERRFST